jgi:hypothetical protein
MQATPAARIAYAILFAFLSESAYMRVLFQSWSAPSHERGAAEDTSMGLCWTTSRPVPFTQTFKGDPDVDHC